MRFQKLNFCLEACICVNEFAILNLKLSQALEIAGV